MKKNYKVIFTLIMIASAYGVNKTGTTSAKFLSIGVGSNAFDPTPMDKNFADVVPVLFTP